MPSTAFVDNELYEKINKLTSSTDDNNEEYPEHEFVASCLRLGLTTLDLEKFSYIEIIKIQYSFISKKDNKLNNYRKASQSDIDKLLN